MSLHPSTAEEFVMAVKSSPVAFVKWQTSWCGPCKTIQPHYNKLAEEYKSQALFLSVEADEDEFEPLASAYKITALPTFQVFVNQKLTDAMTGANAKKLNEFVETYTKQ